MRFRKRSLVLIFLCSFLATTWYSFLTIQQPQGIDLAGTMEIQERRISLGNKGHTVHRVQAVKAEVMDKSIDQPLQEAMNIQSQRNKDTTQNTTSTLTANASNVNDWGSMHIPGIWTYLPHLGMDTRYLYPRLNLSAGRRNATLVFGIPTIRRPIGMYVVDTLESLFDNMSDKEAKEVLIIVCINEPWNITFERVLVHVLTQRFKKELEQGSLEVIAPYSNFYPNLDKLKLTLGDSQERVKWRSKQNLDYAFLMMYASTRGKYYIQLEDDLTALSGFVTSIKATIGMQKKDWTMLQFSQLGFIGRTFKQEDVPRILQFLLMFYTKKPCDWLLTDFLQVELCPRVSCKKEVERHVKLIKPTLFQHQGLRSSLHGTINKLKDKYFGSIVGSTSLYANPAAKQITCTFDHYDQFTVLRVYSGKKIFWGKSPRKEDFIEFKYDPPISIQRIAFQTGHKRWPKDIINKADVEVMPEAIPPNNISYKQSVNIAPYKDSQGLAFIGRFVSGIEKRKAPVPFYTVGGFDDTGNVDIKLEQAVGRIQSLRIRFTENYDHWVIIEQIAVLLVGH